MILYFAMITDQLWTQQTSSFQVDEDDASKGKDQISIRWNLSRLRL